MPMGSSFGKTLQQAQATGPVWAEVFYSTVQFPNGKVSQLLKAAHILSPYSRYSGRFWKKA